MGIQNINTMLVECNRIWQYTDTDSGLIAPWYTLPALQWLKKQDVKQWDVFEYGAGYSTIWWRLNCRRLSSVDTVPQWGKAMGAWVAQSMGAFVSQITFDEIKYDCVVVDGEWREECVEFARDFVKPGGFMIVDNYNQEGFPSGDEIDEHLFGWTRLLFRQANHTSWSTAVFQRPL